MNESKFKYTVILVFCTILCLNHASAENVIEINSYQYLLPDFKTYDSDIQNIIIDLEEGMHCQNLLVDNIEKLNSIPYIDPQLSAYSALINIQYRITVNDFVEAQRYIDRCMEEDDFPFKGRLLFLRGSFLFALDSYSEALVYFQRANKMFTLNSDTLGLIYNKDSQLLLFVQTGNLENAKNTFLSAVSLCQKYDYQKGLVLLYNTYATFPSDLEANYAQDLLKQAWLMIGKEEEGMKLRVGINYLRFLVTSQDFQGFDEVYNEIKRTHSKDCISIIQSSIETLNAHKFSLLNNIDSTIYYNELALQLRKLFGSKKQIASSYLNLCNNYILKGELQNSKMHLDSAKAYLTSGGTTESLSNYLKYKVKYFNAIGALDSIEPVYQELLKLAESNFYQQQNIYLSKIKSEFQVQNQLVQEKYEAELNYRRNIFFYLGIISLLLFIILVRVFILFVSKSRRFNVLKLKSKVNFNTIEEYRKELDQLKNIFENAVTGFFILDKDLSIKYINRRAELIINSSEEMVKENPFTDLFSTKYQKEILSKMPIVLDDFKNFEMQVKLGKTNQDLSINLSFSPMVINNKIESILVIALDISSRVKALEMEKTQKTVLQTLFNSVTESIILMDGKGNIELVNETGAKRLGKTVGELIGANYYSILTETIKLERVQKITQSIEQKKAIIYAENIDSFNTLVSIYPSFSTKGKVEYIAEFTQDITDRKLAYQQINSLRQKVLRSQMNPHFIFNSLNAIQSYVLKNDSEQAVKYLNSFARLIRMILDSSRFDYINLEKEISILEYYLQLQQLRFGDKFIWSMEVDENIDLDSVLIPAMLAQPFIENAIEHGLQHLEDYGEVKISFTKVEDCIVFEVTDNGIGREASKNMKHDLEKENESLSIKIFNERLFTLNKYSGQKITHEIVDLKDENGNPIGTSVIINLPIIYSTHLL